MIDGSSFRVPDTVTVSFRPFEINWIESWCSNSESVINIWDPLFNCPLESLTATDQLEIIVKNRFAFV